jgi:hypothetical protein
MGVARKKSVAPCPSEPPPFRPAHTHRQRKLRQRQLACVPAGLRAVPSFRLSPGGIVRATTQAVGISLLPPTTTTTERKEGRKQASVGLIEAVAVPHVYLNLKSLRRRDSSSFFGLGATKRTVPSVLYDANAAAGCSSIRASQFLIASCPCQRQQQQLAVVVVDGTQEEEGPRGGGRFFVVRHSSLPCGATAGRLLGAVRLLTFWLQGL